MIDRPELEQTMLLVFFAFLGGLTRELNDLITNKINFKNFAIGIITAITTGLIFGKLLIGASISEDIAFSLSGLAGFMGPHVLYILAKALEKKLELYVQNEEKEKHHD